MRFFSVIKYVFAATGIALLIGAFFAYENATNFLRDAVSTQGTIVGHEISKNSDTVSYHPVVRFSGSDGQMFEFTSNTGGSASSYPLGADIDVLYIPLQEEDAKVHSFFALWGGVMVMSILGAAFLFIGGVIFLFKALRKRKKDYLQRNGTPVEAKVQSVEFNHSISINGQNPYVIVCHWLNSSTGQVHLFKSENIWFDPSPYVEQDMIKVFIAKDNPKKYHVDISFLPQLAK